MNRINRNMRTSRVFAAAAVISCVAIPAHAFGPMVTIEEEKLTPTPAQALATLAWSGLAVSGNTVVAGADNDAGPFFPNQGAAYVFVRDGLNWTQQAKITGTGPSPFMFFGAAVDIEGDVIVVGAPDANGPNSSSQGAAHVFTRTGTTWAETARLTAFDGASGDQYGSRVAISGNTIVVGAWLDNGPAGSRQGSAYVYVYDGFNWNFQAKLTASNAAMDDYFGTGVSISGDTITCGAYGKSSFSIPRYGAAYVFVRSAGVWTQQAILTMPVLTADSSFGGATSVDGDTVVIGASSVAGMVGVQEGAAFVFKRSGTTWNFEAELRSPSPDAFAHFGVSLSLEADTVAIGARDDDGPILPDQGGAYVFKRDAGVWSLGTSLYASDPQDGAYYGNSMAIEGNRVYVGAGRWNSPTESILGAVYAYRVSSTNCCKGDLDASGSLEPLDATIFGEVLLGAITDADLICSGDMNNDGIVNGLDIQDFVNALLNGGGCP